MTTNQRQLGWLGSCFEFITYTKKIKKKEKKKKVFSFQVRMKRYKFLPNCSTWPRCAGNWNQCAPLPGCPIHKHEKEAFNFWIGNLIAGKQSTFLASEEKLEGEFSPPPLFRLTASPGQSCRGAGGKAAAPTARTIPEQWDCLHHCELGPFFSCEHIEFFSFRLGLLRGPVCNFSFHKHMG